MEARGENLSGRRALEKADVYRPVARFVALAGLAQDGVLIAGGGGWRARAVASRPIPALATSLSELLQDEFTWVLREATAEHRGPVTHVGNRPDWTWLDAELARSGSVRIGGSWRPSVWRETILPAIEVWARAVGLLRRREMQPARGARAGEEWREAELAARADVHPAWLGTTRRAAAFLEDLVALDGAHAIVTIESMGRSLSNEGWWTDLRPQAAHRFGPQPPPTALEVRLMPREVSRG